MEEIRTTEKGNHASLISYLVHHGIITTKSRMIVYHGEHCSIKENGKCNCNAVIKVAGGKNYDFKHTVLVDYKN